VTADGWSGLFAAAFSDSTNPMVLADDGRRQLDVNAAYVRLLGYDRASLVGRRVWDFVAGGPALSPAQWTAALAAGRSTGEATLVCSDGHEVPVQWGASTEVVTGSRLVLLVVLSTSTWGSRFRRAVGDRDEDAALTRRELDVIRLVAAGRTGPEIGDDLHIAHDTVRTHVRNAMTKLGARSRAHLVAKALAEGHALP
jgi:PAS domain S-box-containing protein